MGCSLLPVLLCALLRHAGVGSREQVQPPLPLPRRRSSSGGGAPPALGGRRAAPVAPLLYWVRGGGWGGGPPARPRVCVGGGGGLGGALWSPGDASRQPGGRGGGGMAVLAPGASHRPGGRALLPPPSIESWILAQALAGAPHPPAVVARRWPAGGGREG